jgi:cobalt/nickel transport system permease protein
VAIFLVRERYEHGSGLLHRIDPCVKIVTVVLFAFAILASREGDWIAFAGFALFVALVIALSGLPLKLVVGRSMLALPFVLVALPLIFTRDGETIVRVPIVGWTVSDEGVRAVASILLKSWLTVLMAVVLTATTRPLDLIHGLERLRLPRILTATVLFMYRYLFVIGEEGQRLMRARDARSAGDGNRRLGGSLTWRARVLGNMVGSLFIRSFERSERIYAAMLARGFDGRIRTLTVQHLNSRDWSALAIAIVILSGLVLHARL